MSPGRWLLTLRREYEWRRLARRYPQYVRRREDGRWELDIWARYGTFSPAMREAWKRNIPV